MSREVAEVRQHERNPIERAGFSAPELRVGCADGKGAELRQRFLEDDQPIGIRVGQRSQGDNVEDAENRRGSPDADGERQDRRDGERRIATELTEREARVLKQRLDEGQPSLITCLILDVLDAAKLAEGFDPRVRRRHASRDVLSDQELEVRLNFLAQPRIMSPFRQRSPEPGSKRAERRHDRSSSRRLTMATVRAQLSASAASCFLPARVIA